jgi:choice-of-anchor C domain-containing protein
MLTAAVAGLSISAMSGCVGGATPTGTTDVSGNTVPTTTNTVAQNNSPGNSDNPTVAEPTTPDTPPAGDPVPVAAPTITPVGGAFFGSVTVTLDCATAGATIQYTTDGLAPTETTPAYTGPFVLTRTRTVQARAIKKGYLDSPVSSALFVVEKPGQLLVNGSFEESTGTAGPYLTLAPGAIDIPGWKVINGTIDWIGTYWVASDGERSLDLDGSPGFGGVEQTFATIPGHTYKVTFDLSSNPPEDPKPLKTMRVEAAGQVGNFQFDSTGHDYKLMGWAPQQWSFAANAASTTLKFYSTDTVGGWGGPVLDNVIVVDMAAPVSTP